MKFRNSFVSNSSSSSFIIFGNKCEFSDTLNSDKPCIWISEKSLNEGRNAVHVTEQFKEYFSKNPNNLPFGSFYIDYELINKYTDEEIVNLKNVEKDMEVVRIDDCADYDDFENFLERI